MGKGGHSSSWRWPLIPSEQQDYRRRLRPSPEQVTANRSALHKIVYVCHQKSGLDVDRVTTCGSVGKHTNSAHAADLDLVVFVRGLDIASLKHQFPGILDRIQVAVDRQYPETRDEEWHRKFSLHYDIAGMEIDILIGVVPNVHPLDFLSVSDPEQRQYMSASVSHLSTRFIKRDQCSFFHDMVRVVKHWRDYFLWDQHSKPKSYLLELIMLEAFRRCRLCTRRKGKVHYLALYRALHSSTKILLKFFELVALGEHSNQEYDEENLPPLFVYFEPYYTRQDIPLQHPKPLFEMTRWVGKKKRSAKTRKATAIVLDPVNPTNNVWLTLTNTKPFVERARKEAQKLAAQL